MAHRYNVASFSETTGVWVMSPRRVEISTTYKTRLASKKPCKERFGKHYWTVNGQGNFRRSPAQDISAPGSPRDQVDVVL